MNPVTACFIRRVSNGYIVKAHDAERGVVVEEVYRTIDEAVDAIAALVWAGEEVS